MTRFTGSFLSLLPIPSIATMRALCASLTLVLLVSCSSLPPNEERETSHVLPDTSDTQLARLIKPGMERNPELSGFHVLNDGMGAFAARILLVEAAEKSIDTQYYIWHDDMTGRVLHNRLLHAADRGVRVRLLLDDMDTAGKFSILRLINAHPNIEIRLYNPFSKRGSRAGDFITDTRRINRRMHIKTLTADNQATIFGGRNVGDEYFDAGTDVGFSDVDALAVGPIVGEVSSQFDLYWNSQWVYPLSAFDSAPVDTAEINAFRKQSEMYLAEAENSQYNEAMEEIGMSAGTTITSFSTLDFSWSKWLLAYDQPSKVEAKKVLASTHLAPAIEEGMDNTQEDLIIVSPYFVPGVDFTAYLTDMVERGVRVRILTNSLSANDVSLVHAGYMRYRKKLVAGGVELFEYKGTGNEAAIEKSKGNRRIGASRASLHAKFFGFDQRYIFIGSFNLDPRSVALNTELGAYFESTRLAHELSGNFDKKMLDAAYRVLLDDDGDLIWVTRKNGEEVRYDKEPETGFWQRFNARLLSIFVPESML